MLMLAENAALRRVMMELGAKHMLRTAREQVHFGRGQHRQWRCRKISSEFRSGEESANFLAKFHEGFHF